MYSNLEIEIKLEKTPCTLMIYGTAQQHKAIIVGLINDKKMGSFLKPK